MKQEGASNGSPPAQLINNYIAGFPDWRGQMLSQLRKLILEAAPGITEEWKWNSPVWSHKGLVCSASAFKNHVKLIFFRGASLQDPKGLFNAGLEAKDMRSIDFHEADVIDEPSLKDLIHSAIEFNLSTGKQS